MPKKLTNSRKLTLAEKRDLDIEIGFMEGIIRREPDYLEALQVLGDDYTRRGRFEDGLRMDEQIAKLRPDDSLAYYNLACSYCLNNRVESAIASLERALSLGYRDFAWLSEDPDLAKVRRHPAYRKIRAKLRTLQIHAE